MTKILQAASTLTDRYQTTIPELVRESLHLHKRDRITYTIEKNGKVVLSRTEQNDPVLGQFLLFLSKDMQKNPSHIHSVGKELIERAQSLISGVDVDLDAPLDEKDE